MTDNTRSGDSRLVTERGVPRVAVSAYTVSRLPDTTADHSVWSVRIEAAGHGRWAIRHLGECLNKRGEWEYEPIPSSRTDAWLATVRWDDIVSAIAAAVEAEKRLVVNGLTSADVLARMEACPSCGFDGRQANEYRKGELWATCHDPWHEREATDG